MNELIFATNNRHKVKEIQASVGNDLKIIPLQEAGIITDIPEPFDTLEANATTKSLTILRMTGKNCFSEDTGLEVKALNGEPGVKSARYAGEDRSSEDNIDKLLAKMANEIDRQARFRTVISLQFEGREYLFEGICEGNIGSGRAGSNGFGYDAIFIPTGSNKTFGEMNMEEKSQYSHRRKATDQLILFLKKQVPGA